MSEPEKRPSSSVNAGWRRTEASARFFVESLAPWLFELGTWVFGALIAVDLLMLGVVLTIGPVDVAVTIATASLALALPLDVAGLVLLRLATDMRKIRAAD